MTDRTPLAIPTSVVITGAVLAGATPDAANGNDFGNNGRQFLWVKNGDSGSHNLTIKTYPKGDAPGGLDFSDEVIAIAAGVEKLVGPFPPSIFNDAANRVQLDWSASTSMKVQVVEFASDPG